VLYDLTCRERFVRHYGRLLLQLCVVFAEFQKRKSRKSREA